MFQIGLFSQTMQHKRSSFHQVFTLSAGVVIITAVFSTKALAQSNPGFSFTQRENTPEKTILPNSPGVEPKNNTTHLDSTRQLTIQQNTKRQTVVQPLNVEDKSRSEPSNTITFPDYYQPR